MQEGTQLIFEDLSRRYLPIRVGLVKESTQSGLFVVVHLFGTFEHPWPGDIEEGEGRSKNPHYNPDQRNWGWGLSYLTGGPGEPRETIAPPGVELADAVPWICTIPTQAVITAGHDACIGADTKILPHLWGLLRREGYAKA